MFRERLDYLCELGIQWLLLLALVFGPITAGLVQEYELLNPLVLLVVQGLVFAAVVLWVVRYWFGDARRLLWPPTCWAVLLFVCCTIVRYYYSELEYFARLELLQVLTYGLVFCLILQNTHRAEAIQRLCFALIFVGMLISLYAVGQYLTGSNKVWNIIRPIDYVGRASGTYICPNHFAGFLEMVLPLALASVLVGRFKPTLKVFLGYAALCMAAGIAVSFSRGGWFASGLALGLMALLLVFQGRQRLPATIFLVLMLAGGIYALSKLPVAQRRMELMKTQTMVAEARLKLWPPAIRIWKDDFWWGGGPGHFDQRFRLYRPEDVQRRPLYAHNDYLNTLADYGLAGGLCVGLALALVAWGVVRSWKHVQRGSDLGKKPSNRFAFCLGGAIGLVAMACHSVLDFNMHIPANAFVAVVLISILSTYWRFASERYWMNHGGIAAAFVTVVGCSALIYMGSQLASLARENACLRHANAATQFEQKILWLKRAQAVEPQNPDTVYQIGEAYRLRSWEGLADYASDAREAKRWFERGMRMNPFDPYNCLGAGLCMDWLGDHAGAGRYFQMARQRDPRNYFVALQEGWHYVQSGEFVRAKKSLEEARRLVLWTPRQQVATADYYLNLVNQRLAGKTVDGGR